MLRLFAIVTSKGHSVLTHVVCYWLLGTDDLPEWFIKIVFIMLMISSSLKSGSLT